MEINLEKEFLIQNPFMYEIYKYCVKKHKRIVCISDMYLPLDFIEKVLKKCGYDIKVYLSCNHFKCKGDQSLYKLVYEKENFEKDKWIHIGDNYECDCRQANLFGIHSYHYVKVLERSDVNGDFTSISNSVITAIKNNMVNNGLETPYWEKFGVLFASPIYYSFANWVYFFNENKDNVCFLSRDGFIVKKIFDMILEKTNKKMDSKYIYSSRRAYQLPCAVLEGKTKSIDVIASINRGLNEKMQIKQVFNYFDLDISKYDAVLIKYGFDSPEDYLEDCNFLIFKQMISSIYQDFEKEMFKKIKLLKDYFNQEGLYKYKTINIVDVGWRGSIQYSMKKLFNKEIFGYYFATNPYVYPEIYYDTKGFAINYGNPNWMEQEVSKNIMLYEYLFSAPEGSLLKFKKNNNIIKPVLEENNEYSCQIETIQNSAISVIKKYLEYYEYTSELSAEEAIWPYRVFMNKKDYNDLVMFSKISTNVGYAGEKISFVPVFSKKYIENDYVKFVNEIEKSLWNKAFLIKGINNKEKYEAYIKYLSKSHHNENNNFEHKLFSLYNFNYTLKHPKRVIRGIFAGKLKKKN